jgi:sugar phosphate isomerase/epimerase
MMNRRTFFRGAGAAAAALLGGGPLQRVAGGVPPGRTGKSLPRFPVGVSDWMILKRQKLGAFPLASEIGVNGVEVDMGSLGNRPMFDSRLADPAVRKQFMDTAASLNLEICSVAMSGFYAQSFSARPGVPVLVQACIDTMVQMQVKTAFLPLGVQDDLAAHPELRPAVVNRLRAAATLAERAAVVIGIETSLDAKAEAGLLDEVGSPAIRSYFNFENPLQAGRDLSSELRILGKDRICQIHCTDADGVWLQNDPLIDMNRVKETLEEMGWRGWLVMERSRDQKRPHDVKWNYGANAAYLKKVFQRP